MLRITYGRCQRSHAGAKGGRGMRRRRRPNICSMLSFSNAGPSKLGASTKQQEYAPKVICCSFMFSLLLKLRDFCFLVESRRAFLA
jgi:hypothetical protein